MGRLKRNGRFLMDSWQKGQIAELKVILRATEKGIVISKPMMPESRYDFIIDEDGLQRVQVKYAGQQKNGSAIVELRKHKRNRDPETYKEGEIDLLLVHIPMIDMVCVFGPRYFIDKQAIWIRFEPTKNNQTSKIILANDFKW